MEQSKSPKSCAYARITTLRQDSVNTSQASTLSLKRIWKSIATPPATSTKKSSGSSILIRASTSENSSIKIKKQKIIPQPQEPTTIVGSPMPTSWLNLLKKKKSLSLKGSKDKHYASLNILKRTYIYSKWPPKITLQWREATSSNLPTTAINP